MATRLYAAIDTLLRDYADIGARSRIGVTISVAETSESYVVSVIGVLRAKRLLILTAPVNQFGALVAVLQGQVLQCKFFSTTTAFRFRARIARVLFEPVPLLHVELPTVVEHRVVRGMPRALVHLRATLKAQHELDAGIVDLSTKGARIAVHGEVQLKRGDELVLRTKLRMMNRPFEIIAGCKIVAGFGYAEPRHPEIQFFGVEFNELDERTLITLHAYVQECLAFETDVLAQMLLRESRESPDVE